MNPSASGTVASCLEEAARSDPFRTAVCAPRRGQSKVFEKRTFFELAAETAASGFCLEEAGLKTGHRVLVMVKPGLDLLEIVFALFLKGAVPVIIDPGMGWRNFLACVRQTAPQALIGEERVVLLSRLFPRTFRRLAFRVAAGTTEWRRQVRRGAFKNNRPIPHTAQPDDLAAILFTSGSTGTPKGVRFEHRILTAQVEAVRRQYAIEPGEVDFPMLPVFALFGPALRLTTVVPPMDPRHPARADPEALAVAMRHFNVTNSFGSPTVWQLLAAHAEERGLTFPALRRILMAGAPVPPGLLERWRKLAPAAGIHTPFGATEALPIASIEAAEILGETQSMTLRGAGTCVGKPLPGLEIRVVEPVAGPIASWVDARQLPNGQVGELIVRGPVVTESYDRLPEATALAKIPGPDRTVWHRMGDLGWRGEDGRIWFCGRKAERLWTAAGTLETDRVEPLFLQHPAVRRCALIGLGQPGAQVPALVVEPKPGRGPESDEDKRRLEAELRNLGRSGEQARQVIIFLWQKELPVDVRHNAKIHRLQLTRLWNKRFKNTPPARPADPIRQPASGGGGPP